MAPITGGVFVLGFRSRASGESVYYFDYAPAGWTSQAGMGATLNDAGDRDCG